MLPSGCAGSEQQLPVRRSLSLLTWSLEGGSAWLVFLLVCLLMECINTSEETRIDLTLECCQPGKIIRGFIIGNELHLAEPVLLCKRRAWGCAPADSHNPTSSRVILCLPDSHKKENITDVVLTSAHTTQNARNEFGELVLLVVTILTARKPSTNGTFV